jgi:hypothetical protein
MLILAGVVTIEWQYECGTLLTLMILRFGNYFDRVSNYTHVYISYTLLD